MSEPVLSYDGPVEIAPCPTCGDDVTNFNLRNLDDDAFSFMSEARRSTSIMEITLIPCGHYVRNARVNTDEGKVAWNAL